MWSEVVCGARWCVERGGVGSEAVWSEAVWSEAVCGVRQCVE